MRFAAPALFAAFIAAFAYPPGDPEPLIPPATGCWDPAIAFEDCAPPVAVVVVPATLPATL